MLTRFLVYLCLILQAVTVFLHAFGDSKWSHGFLINHVVGMILLALITLGIYHLSLCLDYVQKSFKIKPLQRGKNTMMFGFILIVAMSVIGKLAAFEIKTKLEDSLVASVTIPLITALYFGFCFTANRKFKPTLGANKSWITVLLIFSSHAYFLYYTIEKALRIEGPMCTSVVLLQVLISSFGAVSSLDIYVYAKEKFVDHTEEEGTLESVKIIPRELEMKSQHAEEKPIEVIFLDDSSDSEESDSDEDDISPDCDYCFLDHSNSKTPRVYV